MACNPISILGQAARGPSTIPSTWGWEQKFSTAATPAGTFLLQGRGAVLGYTGYLPQCPWGCRRLGSPTVERFPKSASSAVFAANSVISAPCYKCHLKLCPGGKSPLVSLPGMVVSPSCPHPAAQPVASSHRGFQETEAQKAPSGRGVPGVAWPAAILPHLSVSAERRANPHGQRRVSQQGQRHVPPLH